LIALRLLAIVGLVVMNSFFAATEYSLIAVRMSRVRQLVEQGDPRARVVQDLLGHLDRVVSGVQVGVTLASLGLGALGESTLAGLLSPTFDRLPGRYSAIFVHGLSLTIAFLLLMLMHVVIGELVPKSISLQYAARIALLTARPFQLFLDVFRPVIGSFDGISARIVRVFGVTPHHSHTLVHSAEELQIQIQQAHERGVLDAREEHFILSALELDRLQVREIMVPRPDMHVISATASLDDVLRVFVTTQRSRLPVFEGDGDHVLGYVHIKDLFWVLLDRERRTEEGVLPPEFDLRRILREAMIVPETKPASELLAEMRARHSEMALVVDEFGSILGLVTLEDIFEQLVGEIHDEYDVAQPPLIVGHGPDAAMIFDASLGIRDLDMQYNISLPEDPAYATIGGFILSQLGFIPRGGESFDHGSYRFTVVEMDRRRVARVKVQRLKQPADASPAAAAAASVPAESAAADAKPHAALPPGEPARPALPEKK